MSELRPAQRPDPKQTLSDICFYFGFTSRRGKHQRADIPALIRNLSPYEKIIKKRFGLDIHNLPKRKYVDYSLICFIHNKFRV